MPPSMSLSCSPHIFSWNKSTPLNNLFANIGILSYKFNPFNVDNKGYDITKYNVVAIVQIAQNEHDITINQIAAAYKNKEVIWLKDLRCELLNKSKANIFCPIKSSLIPNMFSIELFKKQMDTNFKRCNPFFNERQDYIWWHIFNAYKLWYILKVFGIELKSPIVNSMILGIYENDKTSQCYIVLGYLINNQCKDLFDKVVEVYNERFKIKLKYGLNFIKPYEKQQAN